MTGRRPLSPAGALLLGLSLLALGFALGRGFHTAANDPAKAPKPTPTTGPGATPTGGTPTEGAATPDILNDVSGVPIAKALRLSPDGRTLAFTGVYDRSRRAARFLLDIGSLQWRAVDSPAGWQDYIMGWDSDGRTLLFDRERIPRSVAEASAGLHTESVTGLERAVEEPAFERGTLPRGERTISGFFSPGDELVVKTRREPKALFRIGPSGAVRLDAAANFGQNRLVRENGRDVLYVVRELPTGDSALVRLDGRRERQLTPPLQNVTWTYVAENGAWLVVCREAPAGDDWDWTLYQVSPTGARRLRTQRVPGDANGVFWSPDRRTILGAGGARLWQIAIPSMQVKALGARTDWNADDAAWLSGRELIVASRGSLWRVQAPSGTARVVWKFPEKYWTD